MYVICIISFVASLLTFFSGFGLGTILLPIFLIFFPVTQAITLTAIVHFLNNLFKISLIGNHIQWRVLFWFGFPAFLFAYLGARLLGIMATSDPLIYQYLLFGKSFDIKLTKLIIAALMIVFTLLEYFPQIKAIQIKTKNLWIGGLLSGFFGGLSGHQGALRSMFLVRAKLTKESFIACGVAIAILIDISRISVYFTEGMWTYWNTQRIPLLIATLSTLGGSLMGRILLKKINLIHVHRFVGAAIIVFSIAIGLGWI